MEYNESNKVSHHYKNKNFILMNSKLGNIVLSEKSFLRRCIFKIFGHIHQHELRKIQHGCYITFLRTNTDLSMKYKRGIPFH